MYSSAMTHAGYSLGSLNIEQPMDASNQAQGPLSRRYGSNEESGEIDGPQKEMFNIPFGSSLY
jgi:hypothetical protein